MAKADYLGPEAERLYVIEQCSMAEIASRLGVAERTVRNWKERAGNWDDKRRGYLASKQGFHEELYEFGRELLKSIRTDMAEGKEVSASRLYALLRLLPNLTKVKDFDDLMARKQSGDSVQAAKPDEVVDLIRGVLLGSGS